MALPPKNSRASSQEPLFSGHTTNRIVTDKETDVILCILFGHTPMRTKPALISYRNSETVPNGDLHVCKRCRTLVFEASEEEVVTSWA